MTIPLTCTGVRQLVIALDKTSEVNVLRSYPDMIEFSATRSNADLTAYAHRRATTMTAHSSGTTVM